MVPTLAAPREVTTDLAPVEYLQSHQGRGRFVDLTVLPPNWGSEFALNALNATDLPFPKSFEQFIQRRLYPGLTPPDAFTRDRTTGIVAQETELAAHLRAYEHASVKYVLAPRSLSLLPTLTALGVRPVWHDALATIYALPHPRTLFSSRCDVTSTNIDVATVNCSSTGATLERSELSMAGWTATVNGKPVTIRTVDGVYQSVAVPRGTSRVDYRFEPPHETPALVLALLALVFLLGSSLSPWPRRRSNPAPVQLSSCAAPSLADEVI
jgi:hypothetical protein